MGIHIYFVILFLSYSRVLTLLLKVLETLWWYVTNVFESPFGYCYQRAKQST